MRTRRLIVAALLFTMAAATAAVAAPTGTATAAVVTPRAAPTAGPCHWLSGAFGDKSNCDGILPMSECLGRAGGQVLKDTEHLGTHALIKLWYSERCLTVWAENEPGADYNGTEDPCYVRLQRNSDGQKYYTGIGDPGGWSPTLMLFDDRVTSHAYGYCKYGGRVYEKRTIDW
jgi:hypothetical protein